MTYLLENDCDERTKMYIQKRARARVRVDIKKKHTQI